MRAITDENGTVVGRFGYQPFGAEEFTLRGDNTLTFTGEMQRLNEGLVGYLAYHLFKEGGFLLLRFGQNKSEISLINLEKILAFAWPRFIESKSGLVFIVGEWNGSKRAIEEARCLYIEVTRSRFFDKTDYESSVNHYHVDRELSLKPTKHLKTVCRTIGEMWVTKLKNDFPEKRFRVYLHDTILRFHQIHEGEAPWLNEKDFQKDIKKGKIVIWEI